MSFVNSDILNLSHTVFHFIFQPECYEPLKQKPRYDIDDVYFPVCCTQVTWFQCGLSLWNKRPHRKYKPSCLGFNTWHSRTRRWSLRTFLSKCQQEKLVSQDSQTEARWFRHVVISLWRNSRILTGVQVRRCASARCIRIA